ncbi:hypothetical protein [Vibrio europaeus]|uniref:Uncharacterized protein n=1 Tax=Vibrio europaeus TaxID=300876 RepID=A0A178J3E5_9VIBR|nr:hypothetical protein [Vibrio europaeus]MDC5708432.1 hypothetical protein [Vibrio europaeus]MDC5713094.1 hypothetical protein [Vibrio europaeus]MDC5728135.1 hypothetical protein [Vibrio europaeus]MDC5733271.1 hypothetical protein [Vibrio europaeus]MDC5742352.1 hypothetical protein [Vibrio europaeus]
MSKSSGHVLATLLSSLLASAYSHAGLSVDEAGKQWYTKYAECEQLALNNEVEFPVNSWFESLSLKDKRSVIGYVYNYNMNLCTKKELTELAKALEGHELDSPYHDVVRPLDEISSERMSGIDKVKILEIQRNYSEPFSVRYVISDLELL